MTLADKIRPYVKEIEAGHAAGDREASQVIALYQLHVACPSDPGAPALCSAAFDDWLKKRRS